MCLVSSQPVQEYFILRSISRNYTSNGLIGEPNDKINKIEFCNLTAANKMTIF